MNFEIEQHFRIESARFLSRLDANHPCSRMHGHSFQITLNLVGPLDKEKGWLIDFNEVQAVVAPLLKTLDHRILNEVPGLENPTSELLAQFIYEHLKPNLPLLRQVTVSETPETKVKYPSLKA